MSEAQPKNSSGPAGVAERRPTARLRRDASPMTIAVIIAAFPRALWSAPHPLPICAAITGYRARIMSIRSFFVAALAAIIVSAPSAASPGAGGIEGVWRNSKDSVRIRTYQCGAGICGQVVQASAKAQADAARGGTRQLIGTQVFREFRAAGAGSYRGKVFVPDLNRTFSGTLKLGDDHRLLGKGCILGGLICKTTAWTRVS
jgi:uncharacterized protein (DUF2147 family)